MTVTHLLSTACFALAAALALGPGPSRAAPLLELYGTPASMGVIVALHGG